MKPLRYAVLVGAVLASGAYFFVYLFRWEWHRALVAGIVLVAAEVALAAAAILDRLRSIETRLEAGAAAPAEANDAGAGALARLHQTAPDPLTNFDWLRREDSAMPVFVPLLLGAGVVLSGAAWLVERLARATARPVLERGLAARLAPLGLPPGTLAGAAAPTAARRRSRLPLVLATAAAAAVATMGIDALADATQTRPDTDLPGTTSSVIVAVDPGSARSAITSSKVLWSACNTQLGGGFKVVGMTELGRGEVQVLVTPRLGTYAERRLRGCVGDAITDRIRARVRSVTML